MKDWTGTRACVKCGETSPKASYVKEEKLSQHECRAEHMLRTCLNCGFCWKERTKDNSEEGQL